MILGGLDASRAICYMRLLGDRSHCVMNDIYCYYRVADGEQQIDDSNSTGHPRFLGVFSPGWTNQ